MEVPSISLSHWLSYQVFFFFGFVVCFLVWFGLVFFFCFLVCVFLLFKNTTQNHKRTHCIQININYSNDFLLKYYSLVNNICYPTIVINQLQEYICVCDLAYTHTHKQIFYYVPFALLKKAY